MKIVLDTNVLISGLLTPRGTPAKVVNLIISGKVVLLYDDRILEEYSEVLLRPRFGFDKDLVEELLFFLEREGEWVDSMPLDVAFKDPDDLPFLECAVSGNADALITGNLRHFPKAACRKMNIMSPKQVLEYLLKG